MAHELDFTNGNAAIAITYDGAVPWHGYGSRVGKDADLDQWRIAAGLDWEVDERAVYYSKKEKVKERTAVRGHFITEKNVPAKISNKKALIRTDTQDCLSVVSGRYKVVQPSEVLSFYKDLVESQGYRMDTAGALMGGRRVWALAKVGKEAKIMGQDEVKAYLLLATSYDGSLATVVKNQDVRTVCNNTLEYGLNSEGTEVKVAHSKDFVAEAVKEQLGLTREAWQAHLEKVNAMSMRQVSLQEATDFYKQVLGEEAFKFDIGKDDFVYSDKMTKMFACFESGKGSQLRSARRTVWGLVNGCTEYCDHLARARNNGNRVNSAWFGKGATTKRKAWEIAETMAA